MAGPERRPPWYQREPYPSVVRVLLDHDLLAEGGTAALRLAARLDEADIPADGTSDSIRAVSVALAAEQMAGHLAHGPRDAAAQAIVDVLVEHRAREATT